MKLYQPHADFYVPDGSSDGEALARTSHLAIGAHQDDLEFFAFHGIEECYGKKNQWFTGIVCTDGAGSPRKGAYLEVTDEEMPVIRRQEQRKAAMVGDYSAMIQLDYPSSALKDAANSAPLRDLAAILAATKPRIVYLHNPADKHDSHITSLLRSVEALRTLPGSERPEQVWGCEIWRGLDWLCEKDKSILPTTARPNLQAALNGVFDSQIMGGKRYDLAVMGRRLANATFLDPHLTDEFDSLTYAMDLTPLIKDDSLDLIDFTLNFVENLKLDIKDRIGKYL